MRTMRRAWKRCIEACHDALQVLEAEENHHYIESMVDDALLSGRETDCAVLDQAVYRNQEWEGR